MFAPPPPPGLRFAGITTEGLDQQVQGTNDDAQISKLSCSRAGYFNDAYVQYFVRKPVRRSPLINRGYYSRYAGLRQLLNKFLDATSAAGVPSQVLLLGAGYDTTWFQLAEAGRHPTRLLELDFKQVTQKKVAIIKQKQQLWDMVQQHTTTASTFDGSNQQENSQSTAQHDSTGPPSASDQVQVDTSAGTLISPRYTIHAADLRDEAALPGVLATAGFDPTLPTYILSECVMVYMEPDASNALLRWLSGWFKQAVCVIYEQIRPDDAFGRQMMSNLESRGCPLRGLPATPSLEAHGQRLLTCGWSWACCYDMDSVYKYHLDPQDKQRIEKLEVFDEFEEWHLIQEHYSISVAGLGCAFPAGQAQSTGADKELLSCVWFGPEGAVAQPKTA